MDPFHCHLVANAKYHDTDYARLRLLTLLAEHDEIRTTVASDFSDTAALQSCGLLVTYTCDLRPTPDEESALRDFVSDGGRWLALHGTNALLDFGAKGMIAPRTHDVFMETLGSRFISHPPLEPYTVTVSDPDHPLVRGMQPFEATDELYLCEYQAGVHPLLETRFSGRFESGYAENEWLDDAPRLGQINVTALGLLHDT